MNSNLLRSLLMLGGGASFVAALSFLSFNRLPFFSQNKQLRQQRITASGIVIPSEYAIQQEYEHLLSLEKQMQSDHEKKHDFVRALVSFMSKYTKVLLSLCNESKNSNSDSSSSSSSRVDEYEEDIALLSKYLDLTIELSYRQLRPSDLAMEMLMSGMLFSVVRYVTCNLMRVERSSNNTSGAESDAKSNEIMASACELLNEMIFMMSAQTVQNTNVQKSVYSVLNIVPWMMRMGKTDPMFRQTCSNILSFLSLNNKFIPDDMWDKLALKCMESDVMETLADTMLKMAPRTDSVSQVCMRSSIITCAFLADGRPELIHRFRVHVGRKTREDQATLFRAWSMHSVENADIFKPFALKLIQFFTPSP